MAERFSGRFLGKFDAPYDQCPDCGLLQVRSPTWLDEAYEDAIAVTDTGLVARNLQLAEWLSRLLPLIDSGKGPYLDYGGGIGLLVRLMRDRGFDFRWFDPHAGNALVRGFEHDAAAGPCVAVTAFEVLEHAVDPRRLVEDALAAAGTDTLILSTELYTGPLPPDDWWYFSRETGQHIAFFRRDTLERLAQTLGMRLLSHGSLHLLSRRAISPRQFRRVCSSRLLRAWTRLAPRTGGLAPADHLAMVALLRAQLQGRSV